VEAIVLEQVRKVYANGFEAVHALDLNVRAGEFMVLVGPSGCGKTTVLRMVAGLEEVTSGTIRIGERVANDIPSKDRDIAMVFQNYALYPHMSVAENIGFALRLRGLPKSEIAERVESTARMLGLTNHLSAKPGRLSGGQRQRVAMGRAIVREPAVFLMDEPLSNLDAKLRVEMRAQVTRLQHRLGVATLYVTHDQTEAMTMGDRVAVLRDGELQQCDVPQTLYDAPANVFVAAFIGSPAMNLFEATVTPDRRGLRLGSQTLELSAEVAASQPGLTAYGDRPVIVGIRPEDVQAEASGASAPLEADVDLVEALGSELQAHFTIDAVRVRPEGSQPEEEDEDGAAIGSSGVARVDPRTGVAAGRRYRFAVRTDRLQFFDPATGARIGSPAG
jgi:multiple sugar transport system ATP-binding protein